MIRTPGLLTASSYTSMFFLGVGTAIIGAASGNIGLSPAQTGLLISVQNIGFMFAVLIAGALADTHDKARLLAVGSALLAVSFFLFYFWQPYWINLLVMFFIGAGIGTYEGVADAMLLGLHDRRQGLYISINHFFVTLGCLAITAYLVFLQMDWRRSIVQSAVIVLALAVLFVFSRARTGGSASAPLRQRVAFLRTQGVMIVFLVLAIVGVGIEMSLTGLLTSFLLNLRGYDQVSSKLGLILFLGGIASGRIVLGFISGRKGMLGLLAALYAAAAVTSGLLFFVAMPAALTSVVLFILGVTASSFLPLLITLTGRIFSDMSGTALGVVKLGIPFGGILVPFALALLARYTSFQASLVVFPVIAAGGFVLLLACSGMVQKRLEEAR